MKIAGSLRLENILLVPVRNPRIIKMITAGFSRYPQSLQISRISIYDFRAYLNQLRVVVQPPVRAEYASDTGARVRRIHNLESPLWTTQ